MAGRNGDCACTPKPLKMLRIISRRSKPSATARRSATLSADLAQGRYKAGVGTFADLLNAQGALANARQQLVQNEFNVRTANAQLARAVGGIGEAIDGERR